MALSSLDRSAFTSQDIQRMQKGLLAYPIDPAWDHECECYDSQAPAAQMYARSCYKILAALGELPEGVPKWEKWEREHGGGEK